MSRKFLTTILATLATLCASQVANAVPINITNDGTVLVGDVGKNAVLGSNDPSTSFDWLAGENGYSGIVPDYNSITGATLPTPVETGFFADDVPDDGNPHSFDLTGYVYAVLHYGKGKNGTGEGGGIVAYYLDGMTGFYAFPIKGLGPNGMGGLSSIRLFRGDVNVPDGGATAALLGLGFLGLAAISRKCR